MNTPQYLVGQMVKRANYNIGRVLKEAGLSKTLYLSITTYCLTFNINIGMDRFGSRLQHDISYMQELSRHRQVMPLYNTVPSVDDAWIAPNASLGKLLTEIIRVNGINSW